MAVLKWHNMDNQVLQDFIDYYYYSLEYKDVDCNLFILENIFKRLELNIEQRYWICWLYANTYNIATTWVIWNEFPDFENVDLERLTAWQKVNLSNIKYQKDVKWSKGYLPLMFKSYKEEIYSKATTQREYFSSLSDFQSAWGGANKFYKFGRYSSWFYLQSLQYLLGHNFNPPDLLLGKGSTDMQIKALSLILRGSKDYLSKEEQKSHFLTYNDQYNTSVGILELLVREKQPLVLPDKYFTETVLCAFSKIFREKKSRYVGYYLDRQFEDIKFYRDSGIFWGINWDLLHEAREETFDSRFLSTEGVSEEKSKLYYNQGIISWWL